MKFTLKLRRPPFAIALLLLLGNVSTARQAPVAAQQGNSSVAPISSPQVDVLATGVAQLIMKKKLQSVMVIGAKGAKFDELTQEGRELGDDFSDALTTIANGFQVENRGAARELAKKNGLSETMIQSDALANWIARKAGMAGYVVVQFGEVSSGRVKVIAMLYKTKGSEGESLGTVKAELELSSDQKRVGFRPLDSDWNKPTATIEELKKLPDDRSPHCVKCSIPEFTQQLRRAAGRNADETVSMYVTVLTDGSVGDLAVVRPAPFGMTVTAVETVLQKWRFKPALDENGKSVAFRTLVDIRYQTY